MTPRKDLRERPGYGLERTCADCNKKGRQGIDFSPSHIEPGGKVLWHHRCRPCHWAYIQKLKADRAAGIPKNDATVTFLHDPSGLFTGRSFKFLTFRLSLEKGYWVPGLEVKINRTKYRIVGDELTPQKLVLA